MGADSPEGFNFVQNAITEIGRHTCTADPIKATWDNDLVGLEHDLSKRIPFPPEVELAKASNNRYGLFPEIQHAWCTRDHVLYVWSYKQRRASSLAQQRAGGAAGAGSHILVIPSDSIILTTALVKPKRIAIFYVT